MSSSKTIIEQGIALVASALPKLGKRASADPNSKAPQTSRHGGQLVLQHSSALQPPRNKQINVFARTKIKNSKKIRSSLIGLQSVSLWARSTVAKAGAGGVSGSAAFGGRGPSPDISGLLRQTHRASGAAGDHGS